MPSRLAVNAVSRHGRQNLPPEFKYLNFCHCIVFYRMLDLHRLLSEITIATYHRAGLLWSLQSFLLCCPCRLAWRFLLPWSKYSIRAFSMYSKSYFLSIPIQKNMNLCTLNVQRMLRMIHNYFIFDIFWAPCLTAVCGWRKLVLSERAARNHQSNWKHYIDHTAISVGSKQLLVLFPSLL